LELGGFRAIQSEYETGVTSAGLGICEIVRMIQGRRKKGRPIRIVDRQGQTIQRNGVATRLGGIKHYAQIRR